MEPNVEICMEVDAARLADTFAETVARGQVTRDRRGQDGQDFQDDRAAGYGATSH
jgi:hypothetical protein